MASDLGDARSSPLALTSAFWNPLRSSASSAGYRSCRQRLLAQFCCLPCSYPFGSHTAVTIPVWHEFQSADSTCMFYSGRCLNLNRRKALIIEPLCSVSQDLRRVRTRRGAPPTVASRSNFHPRRPPWWVCFSSGRTPVLHRQGPDVGNRVIKAVPRLLRVLVAPIGIIKVRILEQNWQGRDGSAKV